MMNIHVNGKQIIFGGESLADLLREYAPQPPFAVAVNTEFVPQSFYMDTKLVEGDCIDIVRPVVGG